MSEGLENNEPLWYIDDNIPGVGERPAWLSEKFKTAADLAKSYSELEKKFSTTPEPYDISNSKYLTDDYQPMNDFLEYAREKRVPKDVIDKMANTFDKYMGEFSVDYEEEFKKLGDKAKDRMTVLDNWAKANLTQKSYDALTASLTRADAILALEELGGKMMSNNTVIPSGNEAANNEVPNLDDLKAELVKNLDKYKSDSTYRKDLQDRMGLASKASGYIDKQGA
jgi:hypothetical protein